MSEDWVPLALNKPFFANLDEDAVVGFMTAIENGFINDLDGHTRFPGLSLFKDLGGNSRVYLHDFNGDLIAADSEGQVHRIDRSANAVNVTGVPVAGGRRVVFAKTDRDLLMAAGGQIVRLRNALTEVLSEDAPLATHVGWIDNFTIAIEIDSGRFFHSGAGTPDQWDPLDTFSADGNPDNINSLLITPAREILLGGEKSIEQFDRSSGDAPFARRWAIGAGGVKLPYAITFVDQTPWTINNQNELVRLLGQVSQVVSNDIGKLLQDVDDWSDAWIGGYPDQALQVGGQKCILLQFPNATNVYGTKGVTLCYDYLNKRFFSLYGWDQEAVAPRRWPGWSHHRLWDRTLIGGEGKIYELTPNTYANGDELQRWLVRTAHAAEGSGAVVKAFRLRVVRGRGSNSAASSIRVRCSRDGRPMGPWIARSLGKAGQRQQHIEFGNFGSGSTFQFEISSTDDTAIDLIAAEVKLDPIGH